MAKYQLCCVFDSKVGAFSPPFTCRTKAEAIRSFSESVKDASLPFGKHPADYRLFVVGEFDDNSGALFPIQPDPLIGADEV